MPNLRALFALSVAPLLAHAAENPPDRWEVSKESGITAEAGRLFKDGKPHADHIEMGGRAVDAIVEWKVAPTGAPEINRIVRFPMLRRKADDTHSSLQFAFASANDPAPLLDGKPLPEQTFARVAIGEGELTLVTTAGPLRLVRSVFPSTSLPALLENWTIENTGKNTVVVTVPRHLKETKKPAGEGRWAGHILRAEWLGSGEYTLAPGESVTAALCFSGREDEMGAAPADAPVFPDFEAEEFARRSLAWRLEEKLVLKTPDEALNRMFAMAKLRTVESIAATRGGLMQGPGGRNNFLAAIWCNDNAEYMAPYHAYLGEPAGVESARNTYAWFATFMNPAFKPIPSSVVAEGRGIWNGAGDRGDAAMIAQGATRFVLARGDRELAKEIRPLVEWCLEYCEKKKTADGVIASDADELEHRFSSGKTNLATSSLTYDALISAAALEREFGDDAKATLYETRAAALRVSIEKVFGAEIGGIKTYRYHEGLDRLRAWICLPLAYGILDRAPGTLDALYSPALWTENGLRTDAADKTFWDRSTLFALRASFIAGDTVRGLEHLRAYTRRRLLGDHVPYAIEAWPEAGQSHLSGESGLYVRIFIEGLFGMRPTGFRSFTMTPRLPATWPEMSLEKVNAYGRVWSVRVSRAGTTDLRVVVRDTANGVLYESVKPEGAAHEVRFP